MVLGVCGSTCSHYGCGYQECASALICGGIGLDGFTVAYVFEFERILCAGLNAVKAIHATAVVYPVVFGIYTTRLALAGALAAVYALALIYNRTE
jgi:hypothetical protein